jgi:hypothetical protein
MNKRRDVALKMQRKVLKTRRKSNYAMHFIIVAKHFGGDQQSEYCTVVFPLHLIRLIYPLYTKEGR